MYVNPISKKVKVRDASEIKHKNAMCYTLPKKLACNLIEHTFLRVTLMCLLEALPYLRCKHWHRDSSCRHFSFI